MLLKRQSPFNLRSEGKQRILALGRRASGIETLPLLLLRAAKLQRGRVLINGIDVSSVSLQMLREYVKYVPRRPVMFEGSVLDNLWQPTCDDPEKRHPPQSDVLTVLKFVGLVPRSAAAVPPDLLNKQVSTLRNRERMLLAVARALVQRPILLVLEDLACSLDSKTLNDLDQMLVGQNHLNVLHVSTVATRIHCFERIVVFQDGAIVQDGSPKELMLQPGVLFDMVQETGPVASNRMCKNLGVPARALPSPTAPLSPMQHASSSARDLASTVGVLGPISELDSEESPEKGDSPQGPAMGASQRPCVYAPLEPQLQVMLAQKDVGHLFALIQSCLAALHDSLNLEIKTGLPPEVQQARAKVFVSPLAPKFEQESAQVLKRCCMANVNDVAVNTQNVQVLAAVCVQVMIECMKMSCVCSARA